MTHAASSPPDLNTPRVGKSTHTNTTYDRLVPQALAKRRDLVNRIHVLDTHPSTFAKQCADQLKQELASIDRWLSHMGISPVHA
jgi:hypothetical protein